MSDKAIAEGEDELSETMEEHSDFVDDIEFDKEDDNPKKRVVICDNVKNISPEVEGEDLISLSKKMRDLEATDEGRDSTPEPVKKQHLIREEDMETACGSKECGFKMDEPFKCRFCGLSFVHMNTLRCHERVHNVEEPFVCAKCGLSFRFNAEYEYHNMTHKDQKTYGCKCGRSFYRYTDLLYHKCEIDDGLDDEVIEQQRVDRERGVDKYMKHPLQLYSEVRRQPYMCQFCNKSYGESRELANHMIMHRGERAYKCHVTSGTFKSTRESMWNNFRI